VFLEMYVWVGGLALW